ncbi:MAG: response regulator, partial [Bacteroidota bacterium]|nr:response regulator [Bacteroidota bacterium]
MTSQQGHIIFVDDDEEDHLIMSEYFREAGKGDCIKFIKNGQEALNYLNDISDDASLPSLIVLDLNMPILSGTQTLALLKEDPRYRKIPVLIFSTSENENEKRKCLTLGAHEYIVKPTT